MDQQAVEQYLTTIRAQGDATMRPCSLITPAMEAIAPQRVGTAHLFLRPRFVLADPTGCGKTPQTIAAYAYLKEKDPDLRMLVVTTKAAQFQWKDSLERFTYAQRAEVLGYTPKKLRLSPAARVARYTGGAQQADVWITTYANLAKDEAHILQGLDRFILVLDEVHWVKSYKQDALWPAALHASQKARCAWGLSATPMKNDRYDELYSVMEVVRPGTFGSYSAFRRLYYVMRLVKPKWTVKFGPNKGQKAKPFYEVIGHQNLEHLQAVINPFYLRRPAEVFSDKLPSVTFRIEDVYLDPKQQKLYEDIWSCNWPGGNGQPIQKIAAVTKAQMAIGAPELVGMPDVPNAKLAALLALLQTELRDRKVIIYSKYAQVIGVLARELTAAHLNYCKITGDDSVAQRDVSRQRFQVDPAVNTILLTDAGGEALDLQAADVVLFYDLPWSYGNFQQLIGRARRLGSQHPNILALLLGATRTCDVPIITALQRKEQLIRSTIRQGNTDHDSLLSSINLNANDLLDSLFSANS